MQLWVEKHRPQTFDEIVGNSSIIDRIESQVKSGNMNHLLLLGPPGIGKTTTATVIANYQFGGTSNGQFMEMNASDERGIDSIRNKVKKFAGKKSLSGQYKIVFLDEADSLTKDAQQALRRTMEKYNDTCRFILTGNEPGGFIDAIKSRCSEYEYEKISEDECFSALKSIVDKEDADINDDVIRRLSSIKRGDLRSQINRLQELALLDNPTVEDVATGEDFLKLFKVIVDKQFKAATKMAEKENLLNLFDYLMDRDDIKGRHKAEVSVLYSKYMWRIDKSPDTNIHLNALVGQLIKTLQEYSKQ